METKEKLVLSEKDLSTGIGLEIAIDLVKSTFQETLSEKLNLYKVVSPIAIEDNTGINDDLNGVEKAVTFKVKDITDFKCEIVQSLAKWKRVRIKELELLPGEGIITDMKALRPDEVLSPIHSVFVDQWDWERVITKEQRNITFLKSIVCLIYESLKVSERRVSERFQNLQPILPNDIKFIHSQTLLDMYPKLSPKERENMIAKEHGAVFLMGIGSKLSNGEEHDGRAPDYDDWSTHSESDLPGLNGDIIVWDKVYNRAMELSSMGIRVDGNALLKQLKIRKCINRIDLPFQSQLLRGELPLTIGGGIGQSRVCMFLLKKRHIGEVQAGVWPLSTRMAYSETGVNLI